MFYTLISAAQVASPLGRSGGASSIMLNTNWQFRQVGTQTWYPATVPGTVHTDLMDNGLIDDPFKDNNEKKLQWIENENWEYRMVFDVEPNQFNQKHHELYFEGLDTYAEVFLNGKPILDANNMFRSWRVDVTGQLKEKANELHIVFTSPILKNDSIARANVKLPGGSDTSEYPVWPYTRKAAYHFGWDWAPRFVTSGIWKDIVLESWSDYRIWDVYHEIFLEDSSEAWIETVISGSSNVRAIAILEINGKQVSDSITPRYPNGYCDIEIENPKLWWPNGSGEAHLYYADVWIVRDGDTLASDHQKIGIRTVELVNEPDSIGTSFYFKVNGKPIFMKGANYVPQDVFLPRVKPEQYERLLKQVKNAGMNMLRVWGGGVYERDIFYDLCDEYGILVWQDFMFANTIYPNDKKLLDNIALEVAEQVNRLNKHACLALWCGNNEIKVAMTHWGWPVQYDYKEKEYFEFYSNYHFIFNRLLPSIIAKQSSRIPYVSTSPQSNWGTPENFNHGSMHYWGVWHGDDDFSGFNQNVGRFMVEWGFQSYPDYELLTEYVSPEYLSLESEVMQNRQKSYVGNGKILEFLRYYATYGGDPSVLSFRDFVYNSQWVQALGYEQAVEAHLAKQPHCMGTLLWQLNDCWPGPSWSIINYNGKPKQAYGKVKKHFTN
jgi:beta-mannosidase